jgi:hypothetical protein
VRIRVRKAMSAAILLAALVVTMIAARPADAALSVLKVTPTFIGAPGDGPECSRPNPTANTWVCHVTVSEKASSSLPLRWSATSVSGATSFSPSRGTVSPGQSISVKVTTHLCGGYYRFKFATKQNTVVVVYTCG